MTKYQEQTLKERIENNPYLGKEEKHQLARLLNISEKRISMWFVNMRKARRITGLLAKGEKSSTKYEILVECINYYTLLSEYQFFLTHI